MLGFDFGAIEEGEREGWDGFPFGTGGGWCVTVIVLFVDVTQTTIIIIEY